MDGENCRRFAMAVPTASHPVGCFHSFIADTPQLEPEVVVRESNARHLIMERSYLTFIPDTGILGLTKGSSRGNGHKKFQEQRHRGH